MLIIHPYPASGSPPTFTPGSRGPPHPHPHPGLGTRDGAPNSPTKPCPSLQLPREAPACSMPRRNWLPGPRSCPRAARAVPVHALRAGGRWADPERRGGMRALLPLGSATATACVRTPGPSKASGAGLSRDRPSLTL